MLTRDTTNIKGSFITFEGLDGSGKTVNCEFLCNELRKRGYNVVKTFEPGGTLAGQDIRKILFSRSISPVTELLLFNAARVDHIEKIIKPALEQQNTVVVCDRYIDSTQAYQGHVYELSGITSQLEKCFTSMCTPDFTFFFDADLDVTTKRLMERHNKTDDLNKFDLEKRSYRQRVSDAFMARYQEVKSTRGIYVDANKSLAIVQMCLTEWIDTVFINKYPLLVTTNTDK